MDQGLLGKLFRRPAVRELFERFESKQAASDDESLAAQPKTRTRKPKP